jgi:hypothetical protein
MISFRRKVLIPFRLSGPSGCSVRVVGAVLRCTERSCVPMPPMYPLRDVLARLWLCETQYARAWHDLTLHTADVEVTLCLS